MVRELLTDRLIHALGWTLIHGLWQGALVALAAALLLAVGSGAARVRYLTALCALLGFALVQAITLSAFLGQTPSAVARIDLMPAPVANLVSSANPNWLSLLVYLWLAGVSLRCLGLLGGLGYCSRLRRSGTPATDDWQRRLDRLSERLGIRRAVRLLESRLVSTPMTLGFLAPVILVPLGSLTGLPVCQLEALLVHELGHIRRRDYLVNLLQSLLEALFFYHPAVWWLSTRIRTEREHCCDDLALATTGDPLELARALANLQEVTMTQPQHAMAAAGGDLMRRIRRLTSVRETAQPGSERFLAALTLAILLPLGSLTMQALRPAPPNPQPQSEAPAVQDATETEPRSDNLRYSPDGKDSYQVSFENGELASLSINGREIPKSEWPQHQEHIRRLQEIGVNGRRQERALRADEERLREREARVGVAMEERARERERHLAEMDRELREREQALRHQEEELHGQDEALRRTTETALQQREQRERQAVERRQKDLEQRLERREAERAQREEALARSERDLRRVTEARERSMQQGEQALERQAEQLRQAETRLAEQQALLQRQELELRDKQRRLEELQRELEAKQERENRRDRDNQPR